MRFRPDRTAGILEGDLTPMIDMTFQLIAFFMVLINFSQSEQDERIMLPQSVLAKPPDRRAIHQLQRPTDATILAYPPEVNRQQKGDRQRNGNAVQDVKPIEWFFAHKARTE